MQRSTPGITHPSRVISRAQLSQVLHQSHGGGYRKLGNRVGPCGLSSEPARTAAEDRTGT